MEQLLLAENKWGKKTSYNLKKRAPPLGQICQHHKYSKIIYTTNPIESYHRMVRKVIKTKGAFSSANAILKQIYPGIQNAQVKYMHGTQYETILIAILGIG